MGMPHHDRLAQGPAAHLSLAIIVVGASEQVTKNELRHVYMLLLVHLYRHSPAVVPHRNGVAVLCDGAQRSQTLLRAETSTIICI